MGDAWLMLAFGVLGSELALTYLVGICPLLAVSKKIETAAGLACAVMLVQPVAIGLYLLVQGVLPANVVSPSVALPAIVLCNLVAVQGVTVLGQKINRSVFSISRPFMALLNVNCVLLGISLLTLQQGGGVLYGLGMAAGYGLALVVVAEISARLEGSEVPGFMRGAPIILVSLGIVSLAIQGIHG